MKDYTLEKNNGFIQSVKVKKGTMNIKCVSREKAFTQEYTEEGYSHVVDQMEKQLRYYSTESNKEKISRLCEKLNQRVETGEILACGTILAIGLFSVLVGGNGINIIPFMAIPMGSVLVPTLVYTIVQKIKFKNIYGVIQDLEKNLEFYNNQKEINENLENDFKNTTNGLSPVVRANIKKAMPLNVANLDQIQIRDLKIIRENLELMKPFISVQSEVSCQPALTSTKSRTRIYPVTKK